jgi:hypothetical protein
MAIEPMMVVLVAAMGTVRLIGAVIGWLGVRSAERARARTLLALVRAVGPGAEVRDRRVGGQVLVVRARRAAAADPREERR